MHRLISARRLATAASVLLTLSVVPAVPADDGFTTDENPFARPRPAETKAANAQSDTNTEPLEKLKSRSALQRWLKRGERPKRRRPQGDPLPVMPVQRSAEKSEQQPGYLLPGDEFPRVGPILDDPLSIKLPSLPAVPPVEDRDEPAATPSQLKKVTEILPFFDYEPDEEIREKDPCTYLCPRPDGEPCKPPGPGEEAPKCPDEVPLGAATYEGRSIAGTTFHWEASNLYHNPLYFEDAPLERYGHTHHEAVQPFVSAGKFSLQLLGLPYQMTIDPIHKRMYALGWYRPGDCAPYKHYQIPLNGKAAAVEAGFMTGMFFLFP